MLYVTCMPVYNLAAILMVLEPRQQAVSIHWTGLLDWTTGLDYWTLGHTH